MQLRRRYLYAILTSQGGENTGIQAVPWRDLTANPIPPHKKQLQTSNPSQLRVSCWCEMGVGYVERSQVLAGHTFSCGLPDCYPSRNDR